MLVFVFFRQRKIIKGLLNPIWITALFYVPQMVKLIFLLLYLSK